MPPTFASNSRMLLLTFVALTLLQAHAQQEGDNPPAGIHCYDDPNNPKDCCDNNFSITTKGIGPWNCDVVNAGSAGEGWICDATYTFATYCYPGAVPFGDGGPVCLDGCCASTWGQIDDNGEFHDVGGDGGCVTDINQGCGG
ncbi:hypothetical protein Slin15195_G057910 [Septoria linicola]|uniref:Uncharacterized protein n=1 Tax=Septoria linicola TaxID=215465 RepID=A0A9Q9EJR6_9PEZI|nr:hypothetical protein Slin14017_G073760 [Septoria linicola]USW52472.1 hypothetical protein Slin15195_G057910 [Septoria linicola]